MIKGSKEYIAAAQKKFEGIQADITELEKNIAGLESKIDTCLLYTSDAADE